MSERRGERRLRRLLLTLPALLLSAVSVHASDPVVHTIKAHFTQKQQQTERYVYVPFEVPRGVTRIDIDFKYQKTDQNVVDLGLLEPGTLALGTKAFRGWSGGERTSIFVSQSDATPGYWPGPIVPGLWRVGLGLYKVGTAGVDVEVTVTQSSDRIRMTPPGLPTRAKEPIRTGAAWYAGQLHAHTHNSDGALSVQALAAKARSEGLDFLALTDHNTTAQQREAIDAPGLLAIIGEEITTPGGHMSAWGLGGVRDFIDFRVQPGDPAIKTLFDTAAAKGALAGVNHPYGDCVACNWTHDIPQTAATMEVTSREPTEMLRAVALWDSLLRQGRRVTAVGVSDWHRGEAPLAMPSVRVWAPELSTRAVLDAIRAGRVIIMMDATTEAPEFHLIAGTQKARVGDTLKLTRGDSYTAEVRLPSAAAFTGARVDVMWNGERLASGPAANGVFRLERFAATPGYLRVQVMSDTGVPLALTNPIWIAVGLK